MVSMFRRIIYSWFKKWDFQKSKQNTTKQKRKKREYIQQHAAHAKGFSFCSNNFSKVRETHPLTCRIPVPIWQSIPHGRQYCSDPGSRSTPRTPSALSLHNFPSLHPSMLQKQKKRVENVYIIYILTIFASLYCSSSISIRVEIGPKWWKLTCGRTRWIGNLGIGTVRL